MKIRDVDLEAEVLVVAEVGNNHEGSFDTARKLVTSAAACGAQAVKFQTFRTEHYVSRADEDRFRALKSFELTYDQFGELGELAHSLGLAFLTTPFDLLSVAALQPVVDAFKVASGDNVFHPLLEAVARSGKPVILSTGLVDLAQVEESVRFVRSCSPIRDESVAVLHCVSAYPVAPDEANLRAVATLASRLDCTIGYSDHTVGIDAATIAPVLGARIVEKHFTLDKRASSFRDHQLSADPQDLEELVRRVRLTGLLLGTGEKVPQVGELGILSALRRSITAARDLPQGHLIELSDLTWVRPGDGLAPGQEHLLVGRRVKRAHAAGLHLHETDVE